MSSTLANTVAFSRETYFEFLSLKHFADMRFDSVNVATDVGALSNYLAKKLKVVKPGAGGKAVTGPYGSQG